MKTIALALVLSAYGCSSTGTNGGTAGSGGAILSEAQAKELCDAYCSEPPRGPDCDNGGNEALCVDDCLERYTSRTNPGCPKDRSCGGVQSFCVNEDMWDKYGCALGVDCSGELGACQSTTAELEECEGEFQLETYEYCAIHCFDSEGANGCGFSHASTAWGRSCPIDCARDSDCPDETYCDCGTCRFDCDAATPCREGQRCDLASGRCEPDGPEGVGRKAPCDAGFQRYGFECELQGVPFTVPVTIEIDVGEPEFIVGAPTEVTSSLVYTLGPEVFGIADEGEISSLRCALSVSGGTPATITHTGDSLPAPTVERRIDSDRLTTPVRPNAVEVALSITEFSVELTPGPPLDTLGTLVLTAGEGDCGPIAPWVYSERSLAFPVGSAAR